jgi:CelD/BcsL family acetyltransferase involved in cellulose biosynthesis
LPIVEVPLTSSQWAEFVDRRSDAVPFHHPAWALLLSECYGFRSFALVLEEGPDEILGGLPVVEVKRPLGDLRWVSLPFTDTCPPLVPAENAERLAVELDEVRRGRDLSRIEIRGLLPGASVEFGPTPLAHVLPLERDPEAVARGFKSNVLRNVRKAERSGVVLRRGESERDLTETFYGLHVRTRRRLGVPVQPHRFFRLLWRRALAEDLGFVLLAYQGTSPIAGAVFLTWNGTITYKFGASDPRHWDLRANNLLFWEAIKWGCVNGQHTLDFGRTDASGEGLRQFKLGWGCTESPLPYSTLGKPGATVQTNTFLARSIRHSPVWMTRAIGELLYKYAA